MENDMGGILLNKRSKVFISYSHSEAQIASLLAQKLEQRGINVWHPSYILNQVENMGEAIKKALNACDSLILLLSNDSIKSLWVKSELDYFLSRQAVSRNITILPVLIEDCEIPNNLKSIQYFDIRGDVQKGIDELSNILKLIPSIDFASFSPETFEVLIADLLDVLGFKNIRRNVLLSENDNHLGREIDIIADYNYQDPFGSISKESWIVEVKLYRNSRADIKTINQLISNALLISGKCKCLLVTNSQITLAAYEWIQQSDLKEKIRIIDGTELKRLLLQHEKLALKYFNPKGDEV